MNSRYGKRLRAAYGNVDPNSLYNISEALSIVKGAASAKFDETLEIAVVLGVDPRQADQVVRGVCELPHGTGKSRRVAVFARGAKADEAKAAGADRVGAEDLFEFISNNKIDFDWCISTPDMMSLVGRLGKVLGPRRLMPNPKSGTVTTDVVTAVRDAKRGAVIEFRVDKAGVVHAGFGRVSFSEQAALENVLAFIGAVNKSKPPTSKGIYIRKVAISSTMGVGVRVLPMSLDC